MICITVSDDVESQLRSVARETGGSIDDLVTEALKYFFLERKLDRQDVESARLALQRIRTGRWWYDLGRIGQ
ncbi:MAG: hypothetical protein H7829_00885 [Magnetococcus sp. THC-1_WYH]